MNPLKSEMEALIAKRIERFSAIHALLVEIGGASDALDCRDDFVYLHARNAALKAL